MAHKFRCHKCGAEAVFTPQDDLRIIQKGYTDLPKTEPYLVKCPACGEKVIVEVPTNEQQQ